MRTEHYLVDGSLEGDYCVLNLYFKTTCHVRPHFQSSIGCINREGPLLYMLSLLETVTCNNNGFSHYKCLQINVSPPLNLRPCDGVSDCLLKVVDVYFKTT